MRLAPRRRGRPSELPNTSDRERQHRLGAALHSPPSPRGLEGFVLADGGMSPNRSGEGKIRKAIVEADLVDRMVAMPDRSIYGTPIPACLGFLAREKRGTNTTESQRLAGDACPVSSEPLCFKIPKVFSSSSGRGTRTPDTRIMISDRVPAFHAEKPRLFVISSLPDATPKRNRCTE